MDLPALLPMGSLPPIFRVLPNFYLEMSGDPLIAGAMDLHGTQTQFTWFRSFLAMEE